MATNFWICYAPECLYKGPTAEFEHAEGGHLCPKCSGEDVFPWRKFRCLGCGFEEEQGKFFIHYPPGVSRFSGRAREFEADLDQDPMEEKMEYDCSHVNNPDCKSKSYEQIDDSKASIVEPTLPQVKRRKAKKKKR